MAVWLPIVVRMMLHYTRHDDLMESCRQHAVVLEAIRAGHSRAAAMHGKDAGVEPERLYDLGTEQPTALRAMLGKLPSARRWTRRRTRRG